MVSHTFKVGDRVRRIEGEFAGVREGDICVISHVNPNGITIKLEGYHSKNFVADKFVHVSAYKNTCFICGNEFEDIITDVGYIFDIVVTSPDKNSKQKVCYSCLKGVME